MTPRDVLRSAPPGGIHFCYRESPRAVARVNGANIGDWMTDPPFSVPGMARVILDPDGRLVSLLVVPGERVEPGSQSAEPNWAPLLDATGVDVAKLVPVPPEWAPPVFADRRVAWTGSWPGKPETPVRIEAAATGGRPVSLQLVLPWTRPAEEPAPPKGFWSRAAQLVSTAWFVVVVVGAGIVALRNVRRGRGDRRGALRFALYLGAIRMVWYVGAHHVASPDELGTFIGHLSFAMQRVGLAYVFYLAVEPYARRLWPKMLVSWVRVLEGRFRDPLVGRDLLIGSAAGAAQAMTFCLLSWIPELSGGPPTVPAWNLWTAESLRGTVHAFVSVVGVHTQQLLEIIFPLTTLLIFRLMLRRTGPAIVAVSLLAAVLFYPDSGNIPGYLAGITGALVVAWLVLFRAGLLAFATMFAVRSLVTQMPLTPSPAGWYLGSMLLTVAFIAAPAFYGFWISQAGRPLFRDEILEPAVKR